MSKTNQYLLIVCVSIYISVQLLADIAPTEYKGWTLSPKYDSQVRIVSEIVEVNWSEICKVKARFNLYSHSDTIIQMKIGFPVNLTFLKEKTPGQMKNIGMVGIVK